MGDDEVWVAFLRGMNLGGRRLTNDELCEAVAACGCEEVAAYQASGNVVFPDRRGRGELAAALEDGLERELGYAVPVFLRRGGEVRDIAESTPFAEGDLAASEGKRQVVFLQTAPSDDVLDEVDALVPSGDLLVPEGRELHWLPAAGLSDSTMDLRRLDDITGGTTIRTHGTVQRLAAKFL